MGWEEGEGCGYKRGSPKGKTHGHWRGMPAGRDFNHVTTMGQPCANHLGIVIDGGGWGGGGGGGGGRVGLEVWGLIPGCFSQTK